MGCLWSGVKRIWNYITSRAICGNETHAEETNTNFRKEEKKVKCREKRVDVWIPSASSSLGIHKFYNALANRLKKGGIRLNKIDRENLEYASNVIVICNFCTRPGAIIDDVARLPSQLQLKLFIIIVYINKEPSVLSVCNNLAYVKRKCPNIKGSVEMYFTSELGINGLKDIVENYNALDTIGYSLKISEFARCH